MYEKGKIILTFDYWIIKIEFYDLYLFDRNKTFSLLTLVAIEIIHSNVASFFLSIKYVYVML
jgi:hypothetical protein